MRRRSSGWALAAVTAVLLLCGCTGIPSSGSVEPGLTNLNQDDQTWQNIPSGPSPGASQKDVMRGFVEAASSSADDYAVAREFLTSDYAGQWDPHLGVLIDDGARPYRSDGDSAGVLSLAAVAKVDARGIMLPVQPGPTTDMRFEFEQVDGEWRISAAPAGIILDSTTFSSIWSPRQLYFVSQGGLLVPDTRWFANRSALPTAIVSALLEGPADWLRGSVHSGFPSGTALVSGTVPVAEGKARIDLTGPLLDIGQAPLSEVNQQVRMSLQTVADVNGFELFVDGVQVPIESDSAGPRLLGEVYDPVVMSADGRFGTFVSGDFRALGGVGQTLAEYRPSAVSLSNSSDEAAVRNAQGIFRATPEGGVLVDDRVSLLEPAFDVLGHVWTLSTAAPDHVRVTGPEGTVSEVPTPWLAGREVIAVRVAPEGARIAALVKSDYGSQVLVAGVLRDEAGTPIGTSEEANTQLWARGDPLDLDWVGQQSFAVLAAVKGGSEVTIGGPGRFDLAQGIVTDGAQVSGGGGRAQLRVLGSDGALYASQGSGWQRNEADLELLAKRG